MESLEALENWYNTQSPKTKAYEYEHHYRLIKKDLEVLEQLKEILSMDYLVRVYGYEMAKKLQTYLKSNDAVKEWLDNDK